MKIILNDFMLILINLSFGTKPTVHLLHFCKYSGKAVVRLVLSVAECFFVAVMTWGDEGRVGERPVYLAFFWVDGKGKGEGEWGRKGGEFIRRVVELPTSDLV
jgi:hypothetical protein